MKECVCEKNISTAAALLTVFVTAVPIVKETSCLLSRTRQWELSLQ